MKEMACALSAESSSRRRDRVAQAPHSSGGPWTSHASDLPPSSPLSTLSSPISPRSLVVPRRRRRDSSSSYSPLPRSPRITANRASLVPPPLATTPLTPESLKPLLDTFDRALAHTRYAVCGRAALAVWTGASSSPSSSAAAPGGLPPSLLKLPAHVTVVCPAADGPVLLGWARAAGWHVYLDPGADGVGDDAGRYAVIGVPVSATSATATREGEQAAAVRAVRVRLMRDDWDALERVRPAALEPPYVGWAGEMMRTAAQVLAVPTLLDQFCRTWSRLLAREERNREGEKKATAGTTAAVAGLVLWLLRRLAADAERHGRRARWRLTGWNVPWLLDRRFWKPFVRRYPEAAGLLARCGLRGPGGEGGAAESSFTEYDGDDDGRDGIGGFSRNSFRMRRARGEGSRRRAGPGQGRASGASLASDGLEDG